MKNTLLATLLTITTTYALADTDHSTMDHGAMNHAEMHGTKMNSTEMNHSKMDHSMMNMEGMSEVGMPAKGAKPDKVVHVLLNDDMTIKFKKEVKIQPNDVVQFVVMNLGKQDHEFSIGSAKEQLAHRKMMKSMPHHNQNSGSTITVKPGKAKQLLWHFHGDSNVEFACNIPEHAEQGMVKKITLL